MNILAIDSASFILSVAVSNGDEIFYEEAKEGMKQSELSMDLIDSLVRKAGLTPADLNGVVCMGGPGSFTGLRIGYSIAKGLALSLSIPFAAIPTLELIYKSLTQAAIAANCKNKGTKDTKGIILSLIEARKNAYFFAFFKDGKRLAEDKDAETEVIIEEIKKYKEKIIITGPGSSVLYESIPIELKKNVFLNEVKICYAQELINIAKEENIFNNDCSSFLITGPEYIRKSDAEMALNP